MNLRRSFVALATSGVLIAPCHAATPIRVIAANLSSGNHSSYDPGHGVRIVKGLQPDIVLIQEFNYQSNSTAAQQQLAATMIGPGAHAFRETTGNIPNGVLSRWPIVASGSWNDPEQTNREFAWAKIDIPGPTDLYAVSVHLSTANAARRRNSAEALAGHLQANVPSGAYVVLGGDFNTRNRNEPCLQELTTRFATGSPYPEDQDDDGDTNHGRNKPYDWVLASHSLQLRSAPVQIGADTFPAGLVFDSREYEPLSAVPGVQEDDSDAPLMQHMAVVRNFTIP